MSRGIGAFRSIQEVVPEWMAVVIALITQLGDGWFLLLMLSVLYWTQVEQQDEILLVSGVLACGVGLYRGLKFLFALPRPEQTLLDPELLPSLVRPLYELTGFATGFGFPSGHATGATIAYFGLATVLTWSTPRRRFVAAGTIVALVCFSRVALGVHYLVDTVVGVALGGLLLVISFRGIERVRGDRVSLVFALAIALNLFYVYTSDLHVEAVTMLGVSMGIFGSWQLVVFARLIAAAEEFDLYEVEPIPVGGMVGLAVGAIVLVPIGRHSANVRRGLRVLSFWVDAILVSVRGLWRRAVEHLRGVWHRAFQ
ncbi:phosphoesterase PA-phosphatase [Halobacteriales archaeon QH_2_65_14]|nr:MAG: phosphoesterase PA-phosphatase [Halobacteriales archaeon QH_2_65_14]